MTDVDDYTQQVDDLLDALASDSDVTHAQYIAVLEDVHDRIGVALDAARREVKGRVDECIECGALVRWDDDRWADEEDSDHLCGQAPDGRTGPAITSR